MEILFTYGSVILVSLIAVVTILPLLIKKKTPHTGLLLLLSLSVGTLLSAVFIHFLPEAFEEGFSLNVGLYVLLGFLCFFVLEKVVHHHHKHDHEHQDGHGHAYHLAPMNLIGDGVHNFIDGLVIAGSYAVSIPLGIAATVSVMLHEIPQEVADFGVLLYAGFSKKKAILFNLLSAVTGLIGATAGILFARSIEGFTVFVVPFAAGMFIYIAASNLVPELHKVNNTKQVILQLLAMIIGIGIMVAITLFGPSVH